MITYLIHDHVMMTVGAINQMHPDSIGCNEYIGAVFLSEDGTAFDGVSVSMDDDYTNEKAWTVINDHILLGVSNGKAGDPYHHGHAVFIRGDIGVVFYFRNPDYLVMDDSGLFRDPPNN